MTKVCWWNSTGAVRYDTSSSLEFAGRSLKTRDFPFGPSAASMVDMKPLTKILTIVFAAGAVSVPVWAQNYPPPPPQAPPAYGQQPPYYGQPPAYPQQPPTFPPQQLDAMVSRVALYPDPLLAQILTASTFSMQIPDAAGWARAHSYLNGNGDALAHAIQEDNLPWDPSVIALLPFPTVLDMMSGE